VCEGFFYGGGGWSHHREYWRGCTGETRLACAFRGGLQAARPW